METNNVQVFIYCEEKKVNIYEDEIMQDVQLWINAKPSDFFATGIAKLPDRWRRCIENDGNYFEFLREDDE